LGASFVNCRLKKGELKVKNGGSFVKSVVCAVKTGGESFVKGVD